MSSRLSITLNARLRPMDRGDVYEDPLQEVLDARCPGSEIDGGGTLMSATGEVSFCDLDVELAGDPDEGMAVVIETLESLGAPKGSTADLDDRETVVFGRFDGLAVYLDGTGLPAEVYADNDINELIGQLHESLGDAGRMQSYWSGPTELALYFYGPSEQRMRELAADVLRVHPLARGCRLLALPDRIQD
ncbi:hypothetical protein Cs7R123_16540 [Catellatospora sp. TT07R-123]|uniref:hypothetical protein n=1 Tax=Catellatospora sp. TT07R-123 TaxID=2733863 RepID=UPI001B2517B6|nr:hypothetical protein [Catellatospora sp. TT07R-123]GHJ44312.1 hypothetical protein Cs7R123_16540 [Catellatospora sp. TT07R-123]